MASRRVRTIDEALELAFEEIRELKDRLNQPRTKLLVENWTISENDNGDLVLRSRNGTAVHVLDKD